MTGVLLVSMGWRFHGDVSEDKEWRSFQARRQWSKGPGAGAAGRPLLEPSECGSPGNMEEKVG